METTCKFEDKIVETHKAIYGNGDPKNGILWMTQKNSEFVTNVQKVFWPLVIASVIGTGAACVNFFISVFMHIHSLT